MHNLIILMGTTGVGKSKVADELTKRRFAHINFDGIVKKLYSPKEPGELSEYEIRTAYETLGEETSRMLKTSDVVVDEWFYLKNSFDWFKSKMPGLDMGRVFFFQLDTDLETILDRNQHKEHPEPEGILTNHYQLTHEQEGDYYQKFHPRVIETKGPPNHVANVILSYLFLDRSMRASDSLQEQPIEKG